MRLLALLLAVLPAAATAAPLKAALLPLSAGEAVTDKTATALTDAVASEARKVPGLQLITQQEIATLLTLDRQKSLLGCQQDTCLAELGGALGVERLLSGSIARLGESWLLTLKMMDVPRAKTLAQVDRRLRKGSIDDVLDALPGAVQELFGAAPAPTPPSPTRPAPLPPAWAEEPLPPASVPADLSLATDGKGRFLAFRPWDGGEHTLLAGDGKTFFAQRIRGGGRSGEDTFDYTFWEPRAKAPWQASFGMKDGALQLYCGEKPIALTAVPPAAAKAMLKGARLLQPRWRRAAHALARDDLGTWYYVDRAREPEDSTDFRLYVGAKGKLTAWPISEAIRDEAGELFAAAPGRLKLAWKDGKRTAEWIQAAQRTPLTALDVEANARMVYLELGAYAGEQLGTACDGRW